MDITPQNNLNKKQLEEKMKEVLKKEERELVSYELGLLVLFERFIKKMSELKQKLNEKKKLNEDCRSIYSKYNVVYIQSLC